MEEKDRMNVTGGIQDEEIKSLQEADEGKEGVKAFADSHQFLKLQERVNYLDHKHSETSLERDRLQKELLALQENFHSVK